MTCILIFTYNRPQYLEMCLRSLENTYLPDDALVYIIDDASQNNMAMIKVRYKSSLSGDTHSIGAGTIETMPSDKAKRYIDSGLCDLVSGANSVVCNSTKNIIDGFTHNCKIKRKVYKKHTGLYKRLLLAHDWAFANGYDYVITLPDDSIVNNYFYSYMTYYKAIFPNNIISGFNTLTLSEKGTPRHPVEYDGNWYVKKKSSGSLCIGVCEDIYHRYIRPAIKERMDKGRWYDTLATKKADKDGRGVVCTVPSVAEHIGFESTMGHSNNPDTSFDFDIEYNPFRVKGKPVSVNIATYPPRAKSLATLISRLLQYPIVDKIRVYLNEYDKVPDYLNNHKITTVIGENLKDSGKYYWADQLRDEYYFTVDDDLLPDESFFSKHIELLEQYNGIPFVTTHGKVLRHTPKDFTDFTEHYRCRNTVKGNHWVNLPGTGVMVFDNSKYSIKMFDTHGMSDLHIAKYCQLARIPCLLREHDANELEMTYLGDDTLWNKKFSMAREHNDILRSVDKWMLYTIKG